MLATSPPISVLQVIDLRNQLALQVGKLRAKDVYLQQADSRYLEIETQLISIRSVRERGEGGVK